MCYLIVFSDGFDIQILHFLSCPGGSAQKNKTRFYAGVFSETVDSDSFAKFFPPVVTHEVNHNGFEGFAVQRVVRLFHVFFFISQK
jgi:hypothetical protein